MAYGYGGAVELQKGWLNPVEHVAFYEVIARPSV